jgi:hypothetical protein
MTKARLYVVATPIGNLDDITLRALQVLADVSVIAAEDTRRTRKLASRHGLERPMVSLQEHNEEKQAPLLVERLLAGESVALVSDAGTPLLSDPGYRLIVLAAKAVSSTAPGRPAQAPDPTAKRITHHGVFRIQSSHPGESVRHGTGIWQRPAGSAVPRNDQAV